MQPLVEGAFRRLWYSLRHCSWFKTRPRSSCFSSTPTSPLAFELYFTVPKYPISTWRTTKRTARICNCRHHVFGICHANYLPQSGQCNSHPYLQTFILTYSVHKVLSTCLWHRVSDSQIEHSCCSLCSFSMRTRAGLVTLIYTKSLVLANDENGRASGDIVNLMSVDAARLQEFCAYGLIAISGPLQVNLSI